MAEDPRSPGRGARGSDVSGQDWIYGRDPATQGTAPEPTQVVRKPTDTAARLDAPEPSRARRDDPAEEYVRAMPLPPRDAGRPTPQQTADRYAGRPQGPYRTPDPRASQRERPPAAARPGGPGGPRRPSGHGGPHLPKPPVPHPFRWMRRLRLLAIVVVLLLIAWPVSLVWTGVHAWHGVHQVAWVPSGTRPSTQPGHTYLLVGSDSRKGLTKHQRRILHTGKDAGQRTDTIKLLHFGSGPSILVTIPRDSIVTIPGYETTKINAAFAWGGPKLLVKTIEQNTGIRIDGYFETGFGGLVKAVDAVGGVTICPTQAANDPLSGLHVKKGCQHADGVTALAFARDRHSFALGDLQRGADQDEIIAQVAHKAFTPGTLLNPFKLHRLGDAFDTAIRVGKGMGVREALHLFLALKGATDGKGLTCGVPLLDMDVHWNPVKARRMFRYIQRDDVGDMPKRLCTASGLPTSITG